MGDPVTGVVLGGFVDSFIKKHGDVIISILLKLSKHKDLDSLKRNPDLGHVVLIFDRGYFLLSDVELITLCGANTWGTVKRSVLAFTACLICNVYILILFIALLLMH